MGSRASKLLMLLAMAVALQPIGSALAALRAHAAPPSGHHHHHHTHDGVAHAHHHHHDHGEQTEGHSGDHHDLQEHDGEGPLICWTAPRRDGADAPPSPPPAVAAGFSAESAWSPRRRAKPPPAVPVHDRHIVSRTVVLRR